MTNLISQFTEQNLSSPAILVPTVLLIQALSFREQQDLTSKISEQCLQKILQQPMIHSDLETIGSRKPCLLYQLNNQLLENFLHNRSTVSTRTTDSFPSSCADTSTFLFSLSDPDEGKISPNIPTKELCLMLMKRTSNIETWIETTIGYGHCVLRCWVSSSNSDKQFYGLTPFFHLESCARTARLTSVSIPAFDTNGYVFIVVEFEEQQSDDALNLVNQTDTLLESLRLSQFKDKICIVPSCSNEGV